MPSPYCPAVTQVAYGENMRKIGRGSRSCQTDAERVHVNEGLAKWGRQDDVRTTEVGRFHTRARQARRLTLRDSAGSRTALPGPRRWPGSSEREGAELRPPTKLRSNASCGRRGATHRLHPSVKGRQERLTRHSWDGTAALDAEPPFPSKPVTARVETVGRRAYGAPNLPTLLASSICIVR